MLTKNRQRGLSEIDNFFNTLPLQWTQALNFGRSSDQEGEADFWLPSVDISEEDDKYKIAAELPGMKKEDISIRVKGDSLVIKGERKMKKEEKDDAKYHRIELSYGNFYRSFKLPEDADSDSVKADYVDGLLTVSINKLEKQSGFIEVDIS